MKAWMLAAVFGAGGGLLGSVVATGAGVTSHQPIYTLIGCALFAILGAMLGGVADVVDALERKGMRDEQQTSQRTSERT
jgi:hypothetical protein